MNPNGMFFFNGFPSAQIPDLNGFFQQPPSQGFSGSSQPSQNSYSINQHSCHKRVRDPIENLSINSHNNRVEIASSADNVVVQGHNNKIYGTVELGPAVQIANLVIVGHNNRVENVTINSMTVSGHNNFFIGVRFAHAVDNGVNNKFSNCCQVASS